LPWGCIANKLFTRKWGFKGSSSRGTADESAQKRRWDFTESKRSEDSLPKAARRARGAWQRNKVNEGRKGGEPFLERLNVQAFDRFSAILESSFPSFSSVQNLLKITP
jgi:hypothetical protein